jgi:tetratricopeptide (TPR) repeat protein
MKRFLNIAALLLLSCFAGYAQHTFTLEAPNVVALDEQFRITFTADGKVSDFNWPGSSDFDVVWGPQTGTSTSIQFVNGKKSSSYSQNYTYILQPKAVGTFTLPAASCKVDGKEYNSRSARVEVVKSQGGSSSSSSSSQGSSRSSSDDSNASGAAKSESVPNVSGQDCFIRLSVSKNSVVKGEPLVATIKLYTKVDISGFEDVKFPDYNGFWSQDLDSPQSITFQRESVNGTIYNVGLLRRNLLIAQQTGTLTIDPAEMGLQVRTRGQSSGNSIFDDFFDNYQTVRKKVSSPAVNVTVRPLPAGAPASFKGGVGQYTMNVSLSKDSIKANDAASLIVKISGTGNVSLLDSPDIHLPSDFETYDAKSTDNSTSGASGISGSKTFEIPFIPRSMGKYVIAPIEYSYFDNAKGQYVTLKSDSIRVNVGKGSDIAGGGVAVPGVNQQDIKTLSNDIRYIAHGSPHLRKSGSFFVGTPLFWGLAGLLAALFCAAFFLLKTVAVRRADVAGTKNRKASKMARKRLNQASIFLKQDLYSAFYEELHKALLGYISDKLTMPLADLSRENISQGLTDRSVPEETIKTFNDVLDACEYARYAPEGQSHQQEMQNQYDQAVKAISEIESKVRSPKQAPKAAQNAAVVILLLAALTSSAFTARASAVTDTLWNRGNSLYANGQFDSALASYKAIEGQNGLVSPELYYNIANCCFKLSRNSEAILYYEKALKLDPSYKDAENNLEVCRTKTLDKIDTVPELFLVRWAHSLKYSLSSDGWAWASLTFLLLAAVLLLIYFYGRSRGGRIASLVFACIFFAFTLCAAGMSFSSKHDATVPDTAIVMQPVSNVKSAPGDTGTDVFVIHEGLKVKILDTLGDWVKVEISDGRQGWLPSSDITEI